MNHGKIAVRYARALFETANEEGLMDEVYADVLLLSDLTVQTPEFRIFLSNPVIRNSQVKETLVSVFSEHIQKLTLRFLEMVNENHRSAVLPDMLRMYITTHKKYHGIESATLVTAKKLAESERNKLIGALSKKLSITMEPEERIDEKLLGGFLLRVGDKQIDASVTNRLKKIKTALLAG